MKTFELPIIEVISFSSEEIMAASGIAPNLPPVKDGLPWI